MHIRRLLSPLALLLLSGGPALASTNLLTNASFESIGPNLGGSFCYMGADNCYIAGHPYAVAGWEGTVMLSYVGNSAWGTPSSLSNYQSSQGNYLAGVQNETSIAQSLTLTDAGTFSLSWRDAGRSSFSPATYQVLWDNTVLGSFSTVGGQSWADHTLSITSSSGSHTLSLVGLTVPGDGTAFVDAFSLTQTTTSAVPEPTTALLWSAGLLLIPAGRRTQKPQSRKSTF